MALIVCERVVAEFNRLMRQPIPFAFKDRTIPKRQGGPAQARG